MLFLRWIYTAPDGNEYPIDVFNGGTCRLYDLEKRRIDTKGTKDPIPVHFSDKLDDLALLPQEELNKYSVTFQASPLLLAKLREAKETLSKPSQCSELEIEQQKVIDGMFAETIFGVKICP